VKKIHPQLAFVIVEHAREERETCKGEAAVALRPLLRYSGWVIRCKGGARDLYLLDKYIGRILCLDRIRTRTFLLRISFYCNWAKKDGRKKRKICNEYKR